MELNSKKKTLAEEGQLVMSWKRFELILGPIVKKEEEEQGRGTGKTCPCSPGWHP